MELPVSKLLLDQGEELDLEVLAGEAGLERMLTNKDWNRPGLALAGYLEVFAHDRVQVFGNTETSYLHQLAPDDRARRLRAIFEFPIPCILVTNGNEAPEELLRLADDYRVPVLRSTVPTALLSSMMGLYLEREFAPTTSVHAVFVDVFGLGVLIQGDSGIGKSEIALELIERGHRLIADDAVILRKLGKNYLVGKALNDLQHYMELRGLGFVDIEQLFGFGSVREEMHVSLVVKLVRRKDGEDLERFSEIQREADFLGVKVHEYLIPVEPGRATSIIVEVAALQHRILSTGRDPQRELNEQLIRQMTRASIPKR
ncbi:MAG: HPr(Ser) kinase/phosphatase [Candidatus Sumerlaeia bacterium]|nr:HPr(Ser) kinase/phosphatase [Candidatus Sumerlaeia bacterium]